MKTFTLTLNEETLAAALRYAERHRTTLDALVTDLLVKTVVDNRHAAVVEMFRLMDAHPGNSQGRPISSRRDDRG
jgi:hypothetical protein